MTTDLHAANVTALGKVTRLRRLGDDGEVLLLPPARPSTGILHCLEDNGYWGCEEVGIAPDKVELPSDRNQYGGEKGCGAKHMVVEIWDQILRTLDNGDHTACLLGVEFEKAFN